MAKYIPLDALIVEIKRLEKKNNESKNVYDFGTEHALKSILSFINTLKMKEVDFESEWKKYFEHIEGIATVIIKRFAKHFFEVGMRVSNPITAADRGTAEEIIINLKRVEKDYRIDLTREIEWLRNKVKKGE